MDGIGLLVDPDSPRALTSEVDDHIMQFKNRRLTWQRRVQPSTRPQVQAHAQRRREQAAAQAAIALVQRWSR